MESFEHGQLLMTLRRFITLQRFMTLRRFMTPRWSIKLRRLAQAGQSAPLRRRASLRPLISIQRVRAAAIAGLTIAAPAQASDNLVLVPDWFGTLPVMLVGFVLLIFPLNALLFKPIFRALDERANRIAGARERSAQLEREADAVLTRYETAIREARGESESARQVRLETARTEQAELTTAARGEAERELETAREEMNRAIEEARATLRDSAEGLAQAAAERVLGRALS